MEWDPDRYLDAIRAEITGYDAFQEAVARATEGIEVGAALELGWEPARRRGLEQAGFDAALVWAERDLAVLRATRR